MKNVVDFYLREDILKENYEKFSKIGRIYYPMKSNSNEVILKKIFELYENNDNGFLISNIEHFNKLIDLGVSPSRMCLINVISDDDTVKYLYENGVRHFTFDNILSLKSFLSYTNNDEVKIAIRLNICEIFGVFSHLGAKTVDCKLMLDLLREYNVSDFGLSFYLQKETVPDVNALNKMLDYIMKKFTSYKFKFLDIGGGVRPDDIDISKLDKVKYALGIEYIIVEPGRYFVGNAGYMETTIVKKQFDNTFIIMNGIYSGLIDCLLYHKKFDFYLKINDRLIKLEYKPFDGSKELIICGASSDSGDRVGSFYIDGKFFNDVRVGSKIVIDNTLSYFDIFFMELGGDFVKQYHII